MWNKIYFVGCKGFIKLVLCEEVFIVLMIFNGVYDILIVLVDFYE